MKRSYRYRILSPVICLLSLSYLARQKYTLSPTARVCLNVESLQIVLLFHFVVLHSDRLLLLLLFCCCAAPPRVTGRDLLLCFAAVRGAEGELLLIPSELNFMQAKHNRRSEHELTRDSLLQPAWHPPYPPPAQDAKCFYPCLVLGEFAVSVCRKERASALTHSHVHACIQLRARNTLGCRIMRVDKAELSLHITIILSFSQLPQHLPWRCDISILLEFNLGPLNKTIAYRLFPNWPSPILITWN